MFVITPTSGSQIAVSSAIWPNPRIAELEHEHLGARRARASSSSGSPISVLKFARIGRDRAVRRDQRGDQVLRRRLARPSR